jgi:RNA polymerase sigma factor (sigma-70 family)
LKTTSPLDVFVSQRSALVDYATPIVGDRSRAEDVVQEAFLRYAPAVEKGTEVDEPLRYLYRIVRNLAFDLRRRKTLERREADKGPEWWMVPATPQTPEEQLIETDTVSKFRLALAKQPAEIRTAIEMNKFGGHSLTDVAEHLNMPLTSVHRLVAKGMADIIEELDGSPPP